MASFCLFSFFSYDKYSANTINEKVQMACLGLEPGAAKWQAQTNPLSYGGTPTKLFLFVGSFVANVPQVSVQTESIYFTVDFFEYFGNHYQVTPCAAGSQGFSFIFGSKGRWSAITEYLLLLLGTSYSVGQCVNGKVKRKALQTFFEFLARALGRS